MPKKEKLSVVLSSACRLLHPMHTVLVSYIGKTGKPNIITLAWAMPTSIDPPLVAISVRPSRHSHALIEETGEFVVNIPTMEIVDATLFCGRKSGKYHDKFKETGLTPLPAKKVKPPIIKECVAHLECKLHSQFTTGDHTIFVGEIIEAYANKEAFTEEYDLRKARMVFHLGANDFATLNPKVTTPKLRHAGKTTT
jgi:flavin reductase (DIM6/NTAB) family NADH-FMN oxidoreductase RutF